MITQKIKNLAIAMSEFEGWTAKTNAETSTEKPSVSYRNHNPGNLRRSPFALGTRDNFAYFLDDNIGLFALLWDIRQKCRGQTSTGLTGESDLADLIRVYSAESEDVVANYIAFVEKKTEIPRDTKLKTLII